MPGQPVPGVLLISSGARPYLHSFRFSNGQLELGRSDLETLGIADDWVSRRHVRMTWQAGRFGVTDLDSRNGTRVDGLPLSSPYTGTPPRVIGFGETLCVPKADIRPYEDAKVTVEDGVVVGPALREAWEVLQRAGRSSGVVHITGETGSGKELAARAFHRAGPRPQGPFIAVNCAAIPHGVAERLLFGARRGAYSDAVADADGHFQAAHGGTLFLDEVGELDMQIQGKLLRAVETKEVVPLGASRPQRVEVSFCSATHRNLRDDVLAHRFRSDLYFRIGRPEAVLLPLRERLEDLPWIAAQTLSGGPAPHASLFEACLLRPWPGNVRELITELRTAAEQALTEGVDQIESDHLAEGAGQPLGAAPSLPARARGELPSEAEIELALSAHRGNVTQAARQLGLHRNQLRRWLAKQGRETGPAEADDEDLG